MLKKTKINKEKKKTNTKKEKNKKKNIKHLKEIPTHKTKNSNLDLEIQSINSSL